MKKLFTKPRYMLNNYLDTLIYQLISLFKMILILVYMYCNCTGLII